MANKRGHAFCYACALARRLSLDADSDDPKGRFVLSQGSALWRGL